jgi:hypothetical protein
MKPSICVEADATRFYFADHTAELQRRVGAWFSEHLAELREPLRALVAQRLFLFEGGFSELRRQISVEFSLTFQRTLRVPDDGRDYPLPAGLGSLPVRSVRALQSALIPRAWRDTPTGIVPLHPAEAAWLSFAGSHPFAVQVAAGGVCAVSGLPQVAALSREPQNYLSTPTQPWLDGFRVDARTVRQFVAMPLGHGYTVEAQTTGAEKRGAVQIRVVPLTVDALWDQHVLPACAARWAQVTRPVDEADDILRRDRLRGLDRSGPGQIEACMAVCEEAGFGAGGRLRQEIYADPLPREAWDELGALACEHHLILADRWTEFTGEPLPAPPPTPRDYADAGIPWFDYASPARPLTTPAPLAGIQPVATLFKAKSGLELPGNGSISTAPCIQISGK